MLRGRSAGSAGPGLANSTRPVASDPARRAAAVTEEDFKWGWMVVQTRSFDVEGKYTLAPVADDVNTESPTMAALNVAWASKLAPGRVFELRAARDISANQELLTSYSPDFTNERYAVTWGFILRPNPNALPPLEGMACADLRRLEEGTEKKSASTSRAEALLQELVEEHCHDSALHRAQSRDLYGGALP